MEIGESSNLEDNISEFEDTAVEDGNYLYVCGFSGH